MTVTFAHCLDAKTIIAHPEMLNGRLHTKTACQECGDELTIELSAERVSPDGRHAKVRAAVCCGCEFIREM